MLLLKGEKHFPPVASFLFFVCLLLFCSQIKGCNSSNSEPLCDYQPYELVGLGYICHRPLKVSLDPEYLMSSILLGTKHTDMCLLTTKRRQICMVCVIFVNKLRFASEDNTEISFSLSLLI